MSQTLTAHSNAADLETLQRIHAAETNAPPPTNQIYPDSEEDDEEVHKPPYLTICKI